MMDFLTRPMCFDCWHLQMQKREECSDKKKKPSKSKVNPTTKNTVKKFNMFLDYCLSVSVCVQTIWRQVYEAHDLCMSV